jgi:hypothetical protein
MVTRPTTEERLALAEEVCFTLLLAMEFGILPPENLTQGQRDFIANPMQKWADKCLPWKWEQANA